jgi:hypothetical protein
MGVGLRPAGMRSRPFNSLRPSYYAFPEGRDAPPAVSRQAGRVQVTDPGSKQSGWVAETSLVASAGKRAKQQQAAALRRNKISMCSVAMAKGKRSAATEQSAAAASKPRCWTETMRTQRGRRPRPPGRWMPWDAEIGTAGRPSGNHEDRPRRWWRRRGGSSFFDRSAGRTKSRAPQITGGAVCNSSRPWWSSALAAMAVAVMPVGLTTISSM